MLPFVANFNQHLHDLTLSGGIVTHKKAALINRLIYIGSNRAYTFASYIMQNFSSGRMFLTRRKENCIPFIHSAKKLKHVNELHRKLVYIQNDMEKIISYDRAKE